MSIQRFSSNANRVPDPAGSARSTGAASRAQSPFWQVFTAGGTPPASNAATQAAPAEQTKRATAAAAIRSPLPPAVPAKLPAPAKNLTPAPPAVTASSTTRAPEARRQNDTVRQNDAAAPDPVAAVRAALERIGLNPQQFNMRIDQNPIRFANRQYDYPLLRVDLPNESVGFHLESVMRDPMMTAINISGMMGRPVMNIPSDRLPS